MLPCPLKTTLGRSDAALGRQEEWVGAGTCLPKSAAITLHPHGSSLNKVLVPMSAPLKLKLQGLGAASHSPSGVLTGPKPPPAPR